MMTEVAAGVGRGEGEETEGEEEEGVRRPPRLRTFNRLDVSAAELLSLWRMEVEKRRAMVGGGGWL